MSAQTMSIGSEPAARTSGISSPRTPTGRISNELTLFPHQEIEFRSLDLYELIISIGGIGSGKTTSLVLWLLWLMQRKDFAQVHALFALTTTSLRAISRIIDKILDRIPAVRNRERTISTRPPKEWLADWERRGVAVPPRQDRYENIRIWPCGLHVQMGTVHNKSYEQYRGAEWGTLAAEEVGLQGFTRDAFDFLDERVRCGESDNGVDCSESLGHRHVKILHTNPSEAPDHWIWDMLRSLEHEASQQLGAEPFTDSTEGFPNLIAGVGHSILIPSRTTDNPRLGKRYIESKFARLDVETAKRRLGGALTRTKVGRVYAAFTNLNEVATFDYDPDRTLWVSLDFNKNPAVATLHQPLVHGEFPSEHEASGVEHFGTFGTFFHIGGINTESLCSMLLAGDHGNQSNLPTICMTCGVARCVNRAHRHGWEGLLNHRTGVTFYGDATSNYERMAGNDWEIIDRIIGEAMRGRYYRDVPSKQNPLVSLSVYAFAAKCLSAMGVRSYWMHPRNEELRQDFLTNVWDKQGRKIQKYTLRPGSGSKLYQRTHAADTVRYLSSRRYPLGRDRTPPTDPEATPFGRPFVEPQM